jgi:hypothetical protein
VFWVATAGVNGTGVPLTQHPWTCPAHTNSSAYLTKFAGRANPFWKGEGHPGWVNSALNPPQDKFVWQYQSGSMWQAETRCLKGQDSYSTRPPKADRIPPRIGSSFISFCPLESLGNIRFCLRVYLKPSTVQYWPRWHPYPVTHKKIHIKFIVIGFSFGNMPPSVSFWE